MKKIQNPRIGILQRVLPAYRARFFDLLADAFDGAVSVFAGEGRKTEMITGAFPEKARYHPAANIHLFSGPIYGCWQGNLFNWLREWKPDVLIMEANRRYLRSPAAVRWVRARGGKVIGWGLGAPEISVDLFGIRRMLRRHFLGQFDALITYSSQGAGEYAKSGFEPNKIFIAPNAAAMKPTRALPERPHTYLDSKPVVVFVGRLQDRKRVDILIRACAGLPADEQPLLWLVGDGPMRAALGNLAQDMYPLNTKFFGAKHGAELTRILEKADLFVLPGTGGLAVQEAMAHGLPVIVGEADGTQSDLVRDENGWLLDDPSPRTLGVLLSQALGNVAVLREKGRASYRIVRDEINLERMVSVFKHAVHEVISD